MKIIVNHNEIHKAVWKWLYEGNNGISELSFISAQYDENGEIISDSRVVYTPISIGSSETLSKDIFGIEKKRYNFMLKQYAPITSQSNTPANIIVVNVFEQLVLWMEQELNIGNIPLFPENVIVETITINEGTIAGVDKNGAEFQIILNIDYELI